jgi:hypothetical protein
MYIEYLDNKAKDLRISLLDNIREDVEVSVRYETEIIDSLIIIIENKLKYISVSLNSKFCQIVGKDIIGDDSDTKTIKINTKDIYIKDKIFVIVKMISKFLVYKKFKDMV